MNNNMNFDGYVYPDMSLINNLFMKSNNQPNNDLINMNDISIN